MAYQQYLQPQVGSYMETPTSNYGDKPPITLTWRVNAFVEKKKNVFKKIKNKIRPADDNANAANQNQFYDYYTNTYYQNNQSNEEENDDIKHILKDGF